MAIYSLSRRFLPAMILHCRPLSLSCAIAVCWCLFTPALVRAQQAVTVTLRVQMAQGEALPDGLYVTGNLPELGPWNPALYAMERDGNAFTATLDMPEGFELEFKFTGGGWDREELNADWSTPGNHRLLAAAGLVYEHTVVRFRSPEVEVPYPSPERWERAITAFEGMDAGNPPPAGAIVVIGSSSIVYWHERIHDDLAPLTIIARGFGGAMVNDVLHYAHRMIIPYQPRAVLIYVGENDIAAGVFVPTVEARFRELVQLLRAKLPEARLYLMSQKPSPSRAKHASALMELNDILRAMCEEASEMTFVDITPGMLDEEGRAIAGLFLDDMLHMNRQGYEAWIEAIRPLLLEHELAFEAVPAQP